jgi:hypothetical protein
MGASTSNYCRVVALTYDGWKRCTVSGGLVTQFIKSSPLGEQMTVNGGVSQVSAVSLAAITTGTNNAIQWNATAVPGAFAYAWFTGTSVSAGQLALAAITTINSFTQTGPATGTQTDTGNGGIGVTAALGAGNNYSANGSVFNGLINQAINPAITGATGQYTSLNGATLTGNSDGSIAEIDTVLQAFFDNYKVSPTKMWVSSQQAKDITRKVLQSGSNGVFRINLTNGANQGGVTAGSLVSAYLNKYAVGGPKDLPIEIHPNLPSGKIFFDCNEIPYPLANIPGPYRMHCLRDYYQRLWPQTTETRFTSVNFYGVLQVYTPFAMGLLDNIAAG